MSRRPRADQDDEAVDLLTGAASAAGADSGLADSLLDAVATLARVSVLLAEANADDWKEMKPRIDALRATVKMLPKSPPRRRRVGY
jgi:hypothetical protein